MIKEIRQLRVKYREMGKVLNPALVILHFGLNVIPDVRESYNEYQIALERDINSIKYLSLLSSP